MDAVRFVLILGSSVSAILALVIVAVPIIAPMFQSAESPYTVPEEIKNWGGIIIGFYFGSFLTLVAELVRAYVNRADNENRPAPPNVR